MVDSPPPICTMALRLIAIGLGFVSSIRNRPEGFSALICDMIFSAAARLSPDFFL